MYTADPDRRGSSEISDPTTPTFDVYGAVMPARGTRRTPQDEEPRPARGANIPVVETHEDASPMSAPSLNSPSKRLDNASRISPLGIANAKDNPWEYLESFLGTG